jgi:glucose/arabinose dehydrogenase
MRPLWIGVGLLAAAGIAACQWMLPERYAVNAPLRHLLFGMGVEAPSEADVDARLRVPAGHRITLFAADLPNARMLRFARSGDLLVSTPRSGRVMLVRPDRDGDGRADEVRVLLEGLDRPHGLELHDGWLYVAESGAVVRVRFDAGAARTTGAIERVVEDLPAGGNHFTRTLRFGPDGWMYVSVGSSCNVCEESDPRRAALLRFRPDGSEPGIHASGLRNAVGFDWQPGTGALYATDNGRDLLGDDFPPCELNRIEAGGFYGWPYANGERVPDPDLGRGHDARIAASIPPVHGFGAHNAPLGIAFLRAPDVPEAYRGAALVALHGSWNRTQKDGYKVVSLHWTPDGRIVERDFLVGFEHDGDVIGRPVDVAEGPDGAIYVSDDFAGAIYRIERGESAGPRRAAAPRVARSDAADGGDPLGGWPAERRRVAAARGATLYETHQCASCHEADHASPGVVPVKLAGLAARYDVDALARWLATPNPPMPAFPLDDAQRTDLAVHLLEQHP